MSKVDFERLDAHWQQKMEEFRKAVLPVLYANLDQQRMSVSGNLKDSIGVEIGRDAQGYFVSAKMNFYGKSLEKKETFAYSASAQDLAAWIRMRGLDKFSFVPSYGTQIPDDAAERIAWAIKRSDKRMRFGVSDDATRKVESGKTSTGKRKRTERSVVFSWFYRPFNALYAEHRRQFVDEYFAITADDVLDALVEQNVRMMSAMPGTSVQ